MSKLGLILIYQIYNPFYGHVKGVELKHDVVGVSVVVAVLLGGGGYLLHAVVYA